MNVWITLALVLLGAYLLGSISFAVVSSKMYRLADPRSYGSGNPGATNVLRSGHKKAALLTLMGDALKGVVAVLIARALLGPLAFPELHLPGFSNAVAGAYLPALAGLAAFFGHLFPLFHGFKGGKGVATAAGVLMALNLWLGLATAFTWAIIFFFFRTSSMAALVAALFAAFYQVFLFGTGLASAAIALMSLLLILRHKENIARLFRGEEDRLGQDRVEKDRVQEGTKLVEKSDAKKGSVR